MSRNDEFSWEDFAEGRDPGLRAGQGLGLLPRSPAEALEPGRAPEPPRRRRHRRVRRQSSGRFKGIIGMATGGLTFVLMSMITVAIAFVLVKYQYNRPGPLAHSAVVVIPKGEGVNAIADRLVREGVLTDRWLFTLGVMRFRAQRKLKAGEYEIAKHASVRRVLDTLIEGRAILHKVTIPEGRTSFEVAELLARQPLLQGEITAIPAEGSILPDTYRFSRGTDRQELLERMTDEMEKFIDRLWPGRAEGLPIENKLQALTLASIVEKETSRADERQRIAGIFVNRLKLGMKLQSDPTIIYGLTLGKGRLGRGIRRSELARKTPYNTYQIKGLPPTPICNPGRAAIEAVLDPAKTRDLYFVADGTGGHAFAATLAEHQKNVQAWRKIERARPAAGATAPSAGGDTATAFPGLTVVGDRGVTTTLAGATSSGNTVPAPVRNPVRK